MKPQYTADAKARGVQGTVEVSAIVKADGTVDADVRVIRSLDSDLDQQAIIATRQWTFKPGTKDGRPVDVQVNIEMTFTLSESVQRTRWRWRAALRRCRVGVRAGAGFSPGTSIRIRSTNGTSTRRPTP